MQPLIGITPLWDGEKDSYWMLPGYVNRVLEAGGAPVMLPLTEDGETVRRIVDSLDGLLLTGGPDVNPVLYGDEKRECCGEPAPMRDVTEGLALARALERDIPVLGICRGHQFLNAALGGTLWQDIPAECPSEVCHRQPMPYTAPRHSVHLTPGTPLAEAIGANVMQVNSCHHQAVKDLAPALLPMAEAPDGIVEALYLPGKRFVWGVQWHPEMLAWEDADSKSIFRALIGAAEK